MPPASNSVGGNPSETQLTELVKTLIQQHMSTLQGQVSPVDISPKSRAKRCPKEEVGSFPIMRNHSFTFVLKEIVQSKMLALLGLSKDGRRRVPTLPEPLTAGALPRFNKDGIRLCNPDWTKSHTFKLNDEYITRAVDLIMAEGENVRTVFQG
jgi:hypothetical protein